MCWQSLAVSTLLGDVVGEVELISPGTSNPYKPWRRWGHSPATFVLQDDKMIVHQH